MRNSTRSGHGVAVRRLVVPSSFLGELRHLPAQCLKLGLHALQRIGEIRKTVGDVPVGWVRISAYLEGGLLKAGHGGIGSVRGHSSVWLKSSYRRRLPLSGEMAAGC
jgi:hypothetical protein